MAPMAFRLVFLLFVLFNGSRGHLFETEEITNKKQTTDHILLHLVNSVNKLMVQHAVDITNLENKLKKMEERPVDITSLEKKLHKQHEDMVKMKVQHAVDITKMEHKLQKQQDDMNKQHEKCKEDMKNVMKNHKEDLQRIENKVFEDKAKNSEDIEKLRNEVETRRTADLRKEASEMSAIRTKHGYDMQRLEKKHDDDISKLHSGSVVEQPVIGFDVALTSPMSSGYRIPFNKITTNSGNAWNSASHMFTAPVKGLYFFSLGIMTKYSSSSSSHSLAVARIMRGNTIIRYVLAQRPTNIDAYIPATGSVVLLLNAGETVSAVRHNGYLYSNGGLYTHFVGLLIQKTN